MLLNANAATTFCPTFKMDKVINLGIPHVGELVFKSIDTPGLFQCALVSDTWKFIVETVLIKRWKGRMKEACISGETKVVQLLLDRCNFEESGLNARDVFGRNPFMFACCNGHKDVIQLFLDRSDRIDLNARSESGAGGTAFMLACFFGRKDVVKLLMDHSERIKLNETDLFGNTAMMAACEKGHKDVVQLLLEHSKDVDITIAEGSDCAFSNEIKDLLASKNNLNHKYNLRRIKRPKQK